MPNITFQVIDVNCEQADQSFFVPQISMLTKSTTIIQSWLGYDEFIPSSPPKRYKKITMSGSATRVAFTGEQAPQQCAGASYVYDGVGEIDIHGTQLSNYTKKFYAQCAKKYWPLEPLQTSPGAINTGQFPHFFVGYCWANDPNSCAVCDPNQATWPFLGNYAINNPLADLSAFERNAGDVTTTHTSITIIGTFNGYTSINVNPVFSFSPSGTHYNVTVGAVTYPAESVFTNPASLTFPVELINGIIGEYINLADTSNYSAVLSDEYTDADAAAAAQTIIGTSSTAQNTPRGNNFFSRTTNVVFTLLCTNLISGNDYLVTVDLWDQPANTHTAKSYGFTASSGTHSITDVVPTPAANHTITVKSPTIAFAP